jgi:DNA invertase Pin-like site-specific DNA recombinase
MGESRRKGKAKQALKLGEIRKALVSAGCITVAEQAAVLGLRRSTTYAVLNLDNRAGPSAKVIRRVLSSPNLPPRVRRKCEEYVADKISGRYGHSERRARAFAEALEEMLDPACDQRK